MESQLNALEHMQTTAIDLLIRFGPKVVVAGLILLAGHFASAWVARAFEGTLSRLGLDVTVRIMLVRMLRIFVLALFVVMALQNLGVELLPLIAGLGVAGAGLALAMQGVLSNLAAGLIIIFTRPFKVGEFISIVGEEGEVEAISLFTTVLVHGDRSRVVIPNRKISGEILHNYGVIRQLNISVGVAYDTDIERALNCIHAVLTAQPEVLRDPAPVVHVASLDDSSVTLSVKPWVAIADYRIALGEINRRILESFRDQGIVIPFPQREVRLLGQAA